MGNRPTGEAIAGLIVAFSVCLAPAPATALKRGPCIPGETKPTCRIWTATVRPVDDGDTINVRLRGVRAAARMKVRLTGIQAMELRSYSRKYGRSGECHAIEATERLEQLIRRSRNRVRVAAIRARSRTGSRGRIRRSIAVRQRGKWRDVGAILLEEGLALWFPNPVEWAWNRAYSRIAEDAARRGVGIWNPAACGAGPAQESPLSLKVKWNADNDDSRNINGEWVRITNADPVNDVSLAGWWFRDSHLRRYAFPADARVPALGSIRIHMGEGDPQENVYFWGLEESVFENATNDRRQIGDGGYLFDPDGDLRAYVQYPCRTACDEPLAGKVEIRAAYRAPEAIHISNVSGEAINLSGYEVESVPWFYEFGPDSLLLPGQTFTLWVGIALLPDTPLAKSWGKDVYLLSDKKDVVTLRNPYGAPVTCHAWGGLECPSV